MGIPRTIKNDGWELAPPGLGGVLSNDEKITTATSLLFERSENFFTVRRASAAGGTMRTITLVLASTVDSSRAVALER